jgi:hypothetical protein
MNNIILVVSGVVIASMVARHYGFALDYKRGIEELVGLLYLLIGR